MNELWANKLRSLIPNWFYNESPGANGILTAIATLLRSFNDNTQDHQQQTFIDESEGNFLELIGEGRGRPRIVGETDAEYRPRIKRFSTTRSCASMLQVLAGLVQSTDVFVTDWFGSGHYLPEEDEAGNPIIGKYSSFLDRGAIAYGATIEADGTWLDDPDTLQSFWAIFPANVDLLAGRTLGVITDTINENRALGVSFGITQRAA